MVLQKEVTQYSIIECPDCNKRFIVPEGMDDTYSCSECRTNLMNEAPLIYEVPDSKLIEFISTHFNGKKGEPANG